MKSKRLLSLLMILCMTATMLGSLPIGAFAADDAPQWHYYLKVKVSTKKDSSCRNGNVKAKFEFQSGDEYVVLQNTNQKGNNAYASLTTTRAPWTLKKLTMENYSTDGFRMQWICLKLAKKPIDKPEEEYNTRTVDIINLFPNGTNGNDGVWIQTDDGDKPTYSVSANKRRDIKEYGNFLNPKDEEGDFKGNLYISSHDESGTENYVYNGMINDLQYGYATPSADDRFQYNCLKMSEPPTVSYTVSGKKGNKASVTKNELKSKGGFTDVDNLGFTIDRKKLMEYMNENNVNHITLTVKLTFPRAETLTKVITISRNIFAVSDNLRFSSNYHNAGNDNNFYNNTGDRKINVTATILTGDPYTHFASNSIEYKELTFDEAYLLVGDTGEKLYSTAKSVRIMNNCFTLPFEYSEGTNSNNKGLTLVLNGAKVYPYKYGDNKALELWDADNKKLGLEKYSSTYKIDAVDPQVELSAKSGSDLGKWNKNISLVSIPTETTFAVIEKGKSAKEGYFNVGLYDGNAPVQIRNIKNTAATGSYTEQSVNAMAGSASEFTLSLAEKREGIFTLRLTGADIAGNALSSTLENIRLDNKAPEVKLERKNANDGNAKSVQYAVKISDASGTGRLYYCFSDSAYTPDISSQDPQKHISGEINSFINKWAFIDQADTEGGNGASIYLSVDKGEVFNGRLAWFATDDFGNTTAKSYEDINIINEDSQCDIDSEQSTLTANPNYTVSVRTNSMNRVYWKWIDAYGSDVTEYAEYTGPVNTEADIRTSSLDGTHIFKCKIVMPSGAENYAEKSFVFDNSAPKLNITSPTSEYKDLQTVTVYATDASGVANADAILLNADGTRADGGIYALSVNDGMVSQNINITGVPSGAYKLKVSAADVYGNLTDDISDVFYIRSAAPDVAVSIASDKEFTGIPLVREPSQAKIKLSAHEDFTNAASAGEQSLYCRISNDPTNYGQWSAAGTMTTGENGFYGEFETNIPQFAFADGENKLFVQTAVCAPDTDMSKLNTKFITTAETTIICDSAAPQARLVIDDKHTAEAIEGTLYVTDNIGAAVSAECNDSSVEIKASEDGTNVFGVTVRENTIDGAYITVTDYAGNSAQIPIDINGIDRTAPTADISVQTSTTGERIDARATINVYDAAPGKVQFAFIPEEERGTALVNDKINDKYFAEAEDGTRVVAVYDDSIIAFSENGETAAEWDDEVNTSYTARLSGYTGTYYIGVRAQDIVGNTADIILSDVLTAEDAELTYSATAAPKDADKVSVINLEFNQPIYLLAQDKITTEPDPDDPEKTIDETNLEITSRNAGSYSKVHSLVIRENGEYKLYTVDDIGRKKLLTLNADENLVKFGAVNAGVTTKTFVDGKEIADGEMAGVYTTNGYYQELLTTVEVTPDDSTMHLLPMEIETTPIYYGLWFSEEKSEQYKTDNGYTKLVYDVTGYKMIGDEFVPAESGERIFNMKIFAENNTDESTWSIATAIVENIDNTAPKLSYGMTPQLYTVDEHGNITSEKTTPLDVTVYITMQDKESGISKITLGAIEVRGADGEPLFEPLDEIPLLDDEGNAIDYSQKPYEWSGDEMGVPVKVEYAGDDDLKGAKIIKFVFSDNCAIKGFMATNGVGETGTVMVGNTEAGIDIRGIYKMPIEQGKDFDIKYYYENSNGDWEEMADASAYCRRAKAVVEPLSRWDERGMYVRNNGGRLERELDSYEKSFTFEFRDKYGYSAEAEVEAENFDTLPGTIVYTLSQTEKTNVPISLAVNVADDGSGIGKVELVSGGNATELSGRLESGGKAGTYFASIDKNGAYSIVLYDKVGNRTAENFVIGNLDMEKPEVVRVERSVPEDTITSRSVSATLIFSKKGVRITSVEPASGVTEADYSVSYSSSVITFAKSGTVTVNFADDSGNTGSYPLTVSNIDRTPPALEAKAVSNTDMSEVTVTFDLARTAEGILIDSRRQLSDITVSYGGIAMKADSAKFVFYEKGIYTFKVYDDEGLASYITLELTSKDLDTDAPVIKEIRWSYDYETESGTVTAPSKSVKPGKAGYRIGLKTADGTADNHVTNRDVTVTVITDSETRQLGSDGEYATENSKVYGGNGLYIFNMEKKNTLTDTFGVDVEIIDKTPPVIELIGGSEFVFYENAATGETYTADKRERIETPGTAFTASDAFAGGVDLSGKVEVIYDANHPFDPAGAGNVYDSSSPYTVTYRVYDEARNMTEVRRTIRLIGMYDTMALVNGKLPDSTGTCELQGDTVSVELKNFSPAGTAYVRCKEGIRTMGQMKTEGTMLTKGADGKYTASGLANGWHTFFIQTDKRDYFTIYVYLY